MFAANGILHEFTYVETPEQNAVAERKHQHLLNVARALLFQAKVPIRFWSECILTVVYLINKTPTPHLNNNSPYELLFDKSPQYDHLKILGCLAFASTLISSRNKFTSRARACVFMGYPQGIKGYKLYDINTHEFFISRNVVFHENVFPFNKLNIETSVIDPFSTVVFPSSNISNTLVADVPNSSSSSDCSNPIQQSASDSLSHTADNHNELEQFPHCDPHLPSNNASDSSSIISSPAPDLPRRTSRISRQPAYLRDYECHSLIQDQISTPHPIHKFLTYDKLSDSHKAFIFAVTDSIETTNYNQAAQHNVCVQAMKNELQALLKNNTWTYVTLPPNKKAIGCRWVYKI